MKSSSVLAVHVDFLSPDVRTKRTVLYAVGENYMTLHNKHAIMAPT